jgi:hypothetical protein
MPPTASSAQTPSGVFCAGLPAVADFTKLESFFSIDPKTFLKNDHSKIYFEKPLTLTLGHTLALYKRVQHG